MIICFDTETTSLRPGQICQLSYTMQSGNDIRARNLFFSVDSMDYSAFMVHGFSMEKLKRLSNGKKFKDYIDIIESDFNSASLIVSHNTSFDFMFMRSEFERLGRTFYTNKEFCTMKNFTPICKLPKKSGDGFKYPKLSELCAFLNISDAQIKTSSNKVFGATADYHDARFDTTAVLLALNLAMNKFEEFKYLKDFLWLNLKHIVTL